MSYINHKHAELFQNIAKKAQRMGTFSVKKLATPPGAHFSKQQCRGFVTYAERNGLVVKTENVVASGKRGRPASVYAFKQSDVVA